MGILHSFNKWHCSGVSSGQGNTQGVLVSLHFFCLLCNAQYIAFLQLLSCWMSGSSCGGEIMCPSVEEEVLTHSLQSAVPSPITDIKHTHKTVQSHE